MAPFFCATDERFLQSGRPKASNGQTSLLAIPRRMNSGWHVIGLFPGVRKPRVMQLVLSLSPGGTERLVIEICRQLANRVQSMVVCLDEPGEWAAELAGLHVPVVPLGRQPGFQPALAM